MSFNLPRFTRDLASEAGISSEYLNAVVERAERGRLAVRQLGGNTPLRGSGPTLVVVTSLEGIEHEIEASDRALVRRVVARAADDFKKGILERFVR